MAMTEIEKRFVNRERKGIRNFEKVKQRLETLGVGSIHEVLELGCGIGTVSAFLSANYNMNIYGTDFDPRQIKTAREMYPEHRNLHYGVEDASKLSLHNEHFDLVISQNAFHHIYAWKKAVLEIFRVLKWGGFLFWLDLTLPIYLVRLSKPFVKNYGIFTYDDIKQEFEKCHFNLIFHAQDVMFPFAQHHLVYQKQRL